MVILLLRKYLISTWGEGLVLWVKMVEPNKITHAELVKMGSGLDCSSNSIFYFRMPHYTLNDGLRLINSNEIILDMF